MTNNIPICVFGIGDIVSLFSNDDIDFIKIGMISRFFFLLK